MRHILLLFKVSLHRPRGPLPGLGARDSTHEEPPRPLPRVNMDSVCCLLRPMTQVAARSTRSRSTVASRSQVRVLYTLLASSVSLSTVPGAAVLTLSWLMEASRGSSSNQNVAFFS